MIHDPHEIEFYRQVEDLFATLRGSPHILSPKDFQLLREWWTRDIPLRAIMAGLSEVFLHHRERDEAEPIVSLTYCRHAVERHARRLADAAVGTEDVQGQDPLTNGDRREFIDRLVGQLKQCRSAIATNEPNVAEAIGRIADQLERTHDLPTQELEEHLYGLEQALLSGCMEALSPAIKESIKASARARTDATGASGETRDRTLRAMTDRELRQHLGLPRLELG